MCVQLERYYLYFYVYYPDVIPKSDYVYRTTTELDDQHNNNNKPKQNKLSSANKMAANYKRTIVYAYRVKCEGDKLSFIFSWRLKSSEGSVVNPIHVHKLCYAILCAQGSTADKTELNKEGIPVAKIYNEKGSILS